MDNLVSRLMKSPILARVLKIRAHMHFAHASGEQLPHYNNVSSPPEPDACEEGTVIGEGEDSEATLSRWECYFDEQGWNQWKNWENWYQWGDWDKT